MYIRQLTAKLRVGSLSQAAGHLAAEMMRAATATAQKKQQQQQQHLRAIPLQRSIITIEPVEAELGTSATLAAPSKS